MLFSVWILYRMRDWLRVRLRVPSLELLHERNKRIDAFRWHRVVDAGAHTANGTMAFQVREPGGLRLGTELLVELRLRERERHVHPRTAVLRDGVLVERRRIDRVVELPGLRVIALGNPLEAAIRLQPPEYKP